jgi:hypothetical protein
VFLNRIVNGGFAILIMASAGGCATAQTTAPASTLKPYPSEAALAADLKTMAADVQRRREEEERKRAEAARKRAAEIARERAAKGLPPLPEPMMSAVPAPQTARAAAAPAAPAESVTNVQHAGVDEGGIVKVHGDHLVILRRGRLFTVKITDRELTPAGAAYAYGKDVDARGAWYDEMLIAYDTVIVIGYSYARGGTEIGLFDISRNGELSHRATYHLRSNDYYSSRNYASRLIGSKLVFYTPLRLDLRDPFATFPAMRRWRPDAVPADFRRIAPATRIYRTDEDLDAFGGVALHTVTTCDVAKAELDCESTAVLGPPGRVFYVSPASVFVWTSAWQRRGAEGAARSAVFRIPLDGSAPSALKTAGTPIDQFSFLESEDGHLNVLLRASGGGEGMWAAEKSPGQLGLMRVPLASFSDGRASAPRSAYRALPTPPSGALQSRYVGPYLLYGTGAGWRKPSASAEAAVFATRFAASREADVRVPLVHGVDRIEALGTHAVVVGGDGKDLHFTALKLDDAVAIAGRYTRENAAQGETRSHGFYYRQQSETDGLIGLPVVAGDQPGSRQLRGASAAVLFLRNDALKLTELGTLGSKSGSGSSDDGCVASCVDWYGNSRPLFLRGRILALLGYEIVEGRLSPSGIAEVQRIDFTPHWTGNVR